jgi:putative autotransporter adhesin-like protein
LLRVIDFRIVAERDETRVPPVRFRFAGVTDSADVVRVALAVQEIGVLIFAVGIFVELLGFLAVRRAIDALVPCVAILLVFAIVFAIPTATDGEASEQCGEKKRRDRAGRHPPPIVQSGRAFTEKNPTEPIAADRAFVLRPRPVRRWALFFGLFVLLSPACNEKKAGALRGSGIQKAQSRPAPAFTRLWVGGTLDVRVLVDKDDATLDVKGDDNLLDHVTARMEGDVLKVDTDTKLKTTMPLEVRLRTRRLDSVVAAVASKVDVQGLKAGVFEARAAGAGRLRVSGSATRLDLTAKGAAELDLTNVPAAAAKVRLEQGAVLRLGYLETLDVGASGASKVFYRGDPAITKAIVPPASLIQQ